MKVKLRVWVVSLLVVLFAGCGKEEITSPMAPNVMVIDGANDDWQGALQYYEKQKAALGSFHDNDYFYLCLLTTDRNLQMRIMHTGLTVWLQPRQGKKEKLGIHYPVSNTKKGRPEINRNVGRDPGLDLDSGMSPGFMMMWASDLELLNKDKKILRREPAVNFKDIKAALRNQEGTLVYELAVPLQQNEKHPYAIGAKPDQEIELSLEIATPNMGSGDRPTGHEGGMDGGGPGGPDGGMGQGPDAGMSGGSEGGMAGGRRGGMGGGRPGGHGRPRGGMGGGPMESTQKLKLEMVVRLLP